MPTKMISLRMPIDDLESIDAQAKMECNTRQGIITRSCREYIARAKRVRDRSGVPDAVSHGPQPTEA